MKGQPQVSAALDATETPVRRIGTEQADHMARVMFITQRLGFVQWADDDHALHQLLEFFEEDFRCFVWRQRFQAVELLRAFAVEALGPSKKFIGLG